MDELHLEMVSEPLKGQANLCVVGLGGAGGNAVRRMIESSLTGVNYVVGNTDAQALRKNPATQKLQLGEELTSGLGAGGDPERGRLAAEESRETLSAAMAGSDMVFIAAGMGGGTGTGAAPVVAEIAKATGALTVAIVTRPFIFEGHPRIRVADAGLASLREHVDTLITIPNQRLLSIASQETTYAEAMRLADDVLVSGTRGITDIILRSGDINVDFADVRAVMENRGNALMGAGKSSGQDRAIQAATAAISSPLLNDVSIDGAEALLVNITGGESMTLHEVADATSVIVNAAGEQANVIFGTVVDPSIGDELSVTLIATGFGEPKKRVLPIREESEKTVAASEPAEPEAELAEAAVGADPLPMDAVADSIPAVEQATTRSNPGAPEAAAPASVVEPKAPTGSGTATRSASRPPSTPPPAAARGAREGSTDASAADTADSRSKRSPSTESDTPDWSISRDRPVFIKRLVE
jgi:cell division protein FtsZ